MQNLMQCLGKAGDYGMQQGTCNRCMNILLLLLLVLCTFLLIHGIHMQSGVKQLSLSVSVSE